MGTADADRVTLRLLLEEIELGSIARGVRPTAGKAVAEHARTLFDAPHPLASGGLPGTELASAEGAPGGAPARAAAGIAALPVPIAGARPPLRRQPPRAGEHSLEIAREAALSAAEIAAMLAAGTLLSPTLPVAAE